MIDLFTILSLLLVMGIGIVLGIILQWIRVPSSIRRYISSALFFSKRQFDHPRKKLVKLEVRGSGHGEDALSPHTEEDGHYIFQTLELPVSKIALILIDVWAEHPVSGWFERANKNISMKLLPLVQMVREHGVMVIHSPHNRAINSLLTPLPNEPVIDSFASKNRLLKILKRSGIEHLIYAGYSSNMCVLTRQTGIIEMAQNGYKIIFVRDASLAIEAPEFLEGELTHKVVTYMVETNWGVTTEVNQIFESFQTV